MNRDLWCRAAVPYSGTSNGCAHTDIIHEAEKWNHDEWLDRLFMQTHIHTHAWKDKHQHTHTNTLQTQAALKPVQWVKSQNGSVCLISSQHKLKIHQETKAQSFLLLIWSIYSPSPSAVFYSILHNRQHINVMKFSQYNEVRGSTKRFIITSTLF